MRTRIILVLLLFSVVAFAQQSHRGMIYGKVTDEDRRPVILANIAVPGLSLGATTNDKGYYELTLPADTTIDVSFSFLGFGTEMRPVRLREGESLKLDITLKSTAIALPVANISDRAVDATSLTRLDAKHATLLPSVGGGIENLVKTLPGVVSNSELSSQYRVRGGNFDENLVYVNGIEIYRPFLVGSGQQEGLSFVNSRLVSNIEFSAGGFSAEYGDKMSSVLDVTYKRPRETAGSLTLSLLGVDTHVEGTSANEKFSYLIGVRYKNTSLALNVLDTKGSYHPNFTDVQTLFNYSFNEKWDMSLLGYYSRNQYAIIPESGRVDYGNINIIERMRVDFKGREVDDYSIGMGALTLSFKPNQNLNLKLIASAYSTNETEKRDIEGQYFLGLRENAQASAHSDSLIDYHSVGTHLKHARNAFFAQVFNLDQKGTYAYGNNVLKWGARFQHQYIDDVLDEWEMIDSAGYSLPHLPDSIGCVHSVLPDLELNACNKANNLLSINNFDGFIQHSWTFELANASDIVVTGGLRANYWGFSKRFNISPRVGIAYNPDPETRKIVLRLSGGVYNQVPFYREIRKRNGSLFADADVQKSYQVVMGGDFRFRAWGRPFILTSEAYYKYLKQIIPYEVNDVCIRYYADQKAKGYATGLDIKLNGEFVKGTDSWVSLSLLRTMEDVEGDYYLVDAKNHILPFYNTPPELIADTVFMGWHERPSNQSVSFSLFFQDYIPRFPTWKVSMTLTFGSGLPVSRSVSDFYMPLGFHYTPYRRVDIGFTKQLINEGSSFRKGNPLNYVKNMYLSLEVFNLLNIHNTISYTWLKDIDNIYHFIPNHLTPRYFNLKWVTEF